MSYFFDYYIHIFLIFSKNSEYFILFISFTIIYKYFFYKIRLAEDIESEEFEMELEEHENEKRD